jgi:tyrosinase
VKRFDSGSLEVPVREPGEEFSRVDLVFYGIDHSGPSYEGRVFVNNPAADETTPREGAAGYVGSFTVFGHGGCYGDVGHCDVPSGPRDAFDLRPPHPLTPWTKVVILPDDAAAGLTGEAVTVTVIPVAHGEQGPEVTDALRVDRVRLVAYIE